MLQRAYTEALHELKFTHLWNFNVNFSLRNCSTEAKSMVALELEKSELLARTD